MFENSKRYFAFNIWDFDSAKAVMDAAGYYKCDTILQTSSRVFERMDKKAMRAYVSYYSGKAGIHSYLHLDHCKKIDVLLMAVDICWDSVMIDASDLTIENNIELTNQVSKYAHENGVLVEAEVGQIHGVEEDITVDNEETARISDIKHFLKETNIDMFAAAIGTSHGKYKMEPHIHFDLIREIYSMTDKPFVVHGGSGLGIETLMKLLTYPNVRKINISTDLKQAYFLGIQEADKKGLLNSDGFEPTLINDQIYNSIRTVAENKIKLLTA